MSHSRSARRPGFTLVEMLVVLAIIGILAALLLPAVMYAIVRAKTTAVAIELNQLTSAIESYKNDKGDYPPNFRDRSIVERHIRKCYPKADQTYIATLLTDACNQSSAAFIDEAECLVFWLAMTDNDPRYPFLPFYNPNGRQENPKKYYEFDEQRLPETTGRISSGSQNPPIFLAKNCQDTPYIYLDARSYERPSRDVCRFMGETGYPAGTPVPASGFSQDADKYVRPYWSSNRVTTTTTSTLVRDQYKPINPTSFQLICAGLDGEFGCDLNSDTDVKVFPTGENYVEEEKDNLTNFSDGKRLGDAIP